MSDTANILPVPDQPSSQTTPEHQTDTCPICLEEHDLSAVKRFPNCTHFVCEPCWNTYIQTNNRCPVCRSVIHDETEILHETIPRISLLLNLVLQVLERLRSTRVRVSEETTDGSFSQEVSEVRSRLVRVINLASETNLIPTRRSQVQQISIDANVIPLQSPNLEALFRDFLSYRPIEPTQRSGMNPRPQTMSSSLSHSSAPSFLDNVRSRFSRFTRDL